MKRKLTLFIIFIFLFLYFPNIVNASGISYGDCIKNYGSIRLSGVGNDNYAGGKITGDVRKMEGNDIEFYVLAQAKAWHRVKNFNYTITDNNGSTCTGVVSGGELENGEGDALIYFAVNKDTVKTLSVESQSVKRSNGGDITTIGSISFDVAAKSSEYESLVEQGAIFSGDLMLNSPLKCDETIEDTIKHYWKYVIILAPILLIVMCTIDFMKAVMSSDSDAIQKSGTNAMKRAIAMFLLMLLPTILIIIFKWFGIESSLCF